MRPTRVSCNFDEPGWSDWRELRKPRIPGAVASWLRDQGSLTQRVKTACGERFRVRLLRQCWGPPLRSERRLLRMRRGEVAVVREVELLCSDQPWVFARTLIPARSLRGSVRRLVRLGERPLGAVLFADRQVSRGLTQMARLRPGHRLFAAACAHLDPVPDGLWGRRTLFSISGRRLLVNEIFLPDLLREPTGSRGT